MNFTKVKLGNGSPLILINLPGVKAVTISAFIKAGFKYDPKDKPGLAHFTEHMLFDGTKNYPSTKELSWAIEKYGGWHYAFTWIEHQAHAIHLPKDRIEKGIVVLTDMLISPLLEEKEIVREKGMIKEEILRNKSDPEKAVLDYAWQPLFFEGTSIARPYSGVEQDIDKFTKDDINKFLENNFLADSTAISAATLANGEKTADSTPTLIWNNTRKDIYYYEVQVSGDPDFEMDPEKARSFVYWNLIHGGMTNPADSWTVPDNAALPPGKYYWRARPRIQGSGMPVEWTPVFSFEIIPASTAQKLQEIHNLFVDNHVVNPTIVRLKEGSVKVRLNPQEGVLLNREQRRKLARLPRKEPLLLAA